MSKDQELLGNPLDLIREDIRNEDPLLSERPKTTTVKGQPLVIYTADEVTIDFEKMTLTFIMADRSVFSLRRTLVSGVKILKMESLGRNTLITIELDGDLKVLEVKKNSISYFTSPPSATAEQNIPITHEDIGLPSLASSPASPADSVFQVGKLGLTGKMSPPPVVYDGPFYPRVFTSIEEQVLDKLITGECHIEALMEIGCSRLTLHELMKLGVIDGEIKKDGKISQTGETYFHRTAPAAQEIHVKNKITQDLFNIGVDILDFDILTDLVKKLSTEHRIPKYVIWIFLIQRQTSKPDFELNIKKILEEAILDLLEVNIDAELNLEQIMDAFKKVNLFTIKDLVTPALVRLSKQKRITQNNNFSPAKFSHKEKQDESKTEKKRPTPEKLEVLTGNITDFETVGIADEVNTIIATFKHRGEKCKAKLTFLTDKDGNVSIRVRSQEVIE